MHLQPITLISFGYFEKNFLEELANEVSLEFHSPVKIIKGHLDLSDFHDSTRRQYNGNELLKKVDSTFSSDNVKTLGLFSVDLFIPILTFIFGQAYLEGRTGIASLYRFGNERYGMQKDDEIQYTRLKKEVIHELGHMFGLIHCHMPSCVMRSSTYVEDIDQKSLNLCFTCRSKMDLLD